MTETEGRPRYLLVTQQQVQSEGCPLAAWPANHCAPARPAHVKQRKIIADRRSVIEDVTVRDRLRAQGKLSREVIKVSEKKA